MFLESFAGEIEISNLKECKPMNKDENFYFLAWVTDPKIRNRDNQIKVKNYFAFDLDCRSLIAKDNEMNPEDIPDSEILWIADFFVESMKDNEFWDWRYIVFSWNGLHIYYTWKELRVPEDITASEYQDAMIAYQMEFRSIFWSAYMIPDTACVNIWRIFRLPWSINQRSKYPKLWPIECRILYTQDKDSEFVWEMPKIWKIVQQKRLQILQQEKEKREKQREVKIRSWELNRDSERMKDEINSIPIEDVFDKLWIIQHWWFTGRNWIDPRDRSYFSFYKDKENFIHVANSTTLAPYSWWKDWLDNFSLVMHSLNLDFPRAIEWLKNNFYSK